MNSDTASLHIPPKYNLQGRRQLWFVEGARLDDLLNGLLTALLVIGSIAVAVGGGGLW